jgi:hypothetical protein
LGRKGKGRDTTHMTQNIFHAAHKLGNLYSILKQDPIVGLLLTVSGTILTASLASISMWFNLFAIMIVLGLFQMLYILWKTRKDE